MNSARREREPIDTDQTGGGCVRIDRIPCPIVSSLFGQTNDDKIDATELETHGAGVQRSVRYLVGPVCPNEDRRPCDAHGRHVDVYSGATNKGHGFLNGCGKSKFSMSVEIVSDGQICLGRHRKHILIEIEWNRVGGIERGVAASSIHQQRTVVESRRRFISLFKVDHRVIGARINLTKALI